MEGPGGRGPGTQGQHPAQSSSLREGLGSLVMVNPDGLSAQTPVGPRPLPAPVPGLGLPPGPPTRLPSPTSGPAETLGAGMGF